MGLPIFGTMDYSLAYNNTPVKGYKPTTIQTNVPNTTCDYPVNARKIRTDTPNWGQIAPTSLSPLYKQQHELSQENSTNNQIIKYFSRVNTSLFSPISMTSVLLSLYLASAGSTKQLLHQYLALPPNCNVMHIIEMFGNTQYNNVFKIANAIFYDNTLHIESNNPLISSRFVHIEGVNCTSPQKVVDHINKWVSNNTEGQIQNILNLSNVSNSELNTWILNTAYFNGLWEHPFGTTSGMFNGIMVHNMMELMNSKGLNLMYYENQEYQVVSLPYKNGFEMTIILPRMGKPHSIDIGQYNHLLSYQKVNTIIIPQFRKKLRLYYKQYANQLGLSELFDKSDLTDLFQHYNDAYISELIQEVVIDVTPTGTMAAAVTTVCMLQYNCSGKSVHFIADHPFSYSIKHSDSKIILFSGIVSDLNEIIEPNTV
jgi:serine protease inhibitor